MITLPDFDKLTERVADEVFDRIVRRTPRQSGRAQDGWEIDKTGDGIVIKNDVPYIGILENGWSDQAPTGMVRITLEEVDDIIKAQLEERTNESQVQG